MMHSITVQDIRYFFDPTFPENNSIPTVNTNLSGPHILWGAPSIQSEFKFPGSAGIDFILRNNDNIKDFQWNGLTSLGIFLIFIIRIG